MYTENSHLSLLLGLDVKVLGVNIIGLWCQRPLRAAPSRLPARPCSHALLPTHLLLARRPLQQGGWAATALGCTTSANWRGSSVVPSVTRHEDNRLPKLHSSPYTLATSKLLALVRGPTNMSCV